MTTYFISGHRIIEPGPWKKYYIPLISRRAKDPEVSFVVGDYEGIDTIAQVFLWYGNKPNVTVYHMFDKPRNNPCGLPTKGGFKTDIERDAAMTSASDFDIAWVNPEFLGKNSGTEQNIIRREKGNQFTCASCLTDKVWWDYCPICR